MELPPPVVVSDYQGAFKMPDPNNFSIDVPNPTQSFLQGFAGAQQLQTLQAQKQLQLQEMQRKQQLNQDLNNLAANPTPTAIAAISVKYPELSEHFKRAFDMQSDVQKQNSLNQATEVYSALLSGDNDIAVNMLRKQAQAYKNSGMQSQADHNEAVAKQIELHPGAVAGTTGAALFAGLGPEKFASTFATLDKTQQDNQLQPYQLRTTAANASKAETEAGYAPQQAQEDIKTKQINRQIAMLDTQIKQANSETERGKLQLERDKLQNEINMKQQDIGNASQDAIDATTNALGTVTALMNHPGLSKGTGTGASVMSFFNSTDGNDFRKMVDTLKSQQFLSSIKNMKGLGALSDAEGQRITNAIANLDPDQSTQQFKNALGVVKNTLEKAQSRTLSQGKMPQTNGAFVQKHPTFGTITEGDINRLMAKNPGSTREQVIQYLNATTGTGAQ
jgi:hypothetical protein